MTPTTKAVTTAAAAATLLAAAGAGAATAESVAAGAAHGSPGVVSGNVIQIPVYVPINLCSLSLNVVGLLNPASGNVCISS
ncbi:chaplin [Streptomyces roseifaciens]